MSPAASNRPVLTDGEGLADARQQFLTFENVEPQHVRDTILASWWRSRRWNVAADRIDLSYTGEPDLDTSLTRSAMPVLRTLREHLESQPISVILTDASPSPVSSADSGTISVRAATKPTCWCVMSQYGLLDDSPQRQSAMRRRAVGASRPYRLMRDGPSRST